MDEAIKATVLFIGPDFVLPALEGSRSSCRLVSVGSREQLREMLSFADALLDASMRIALDRDLLLAAPKLKIVATATTGANHVCRPTLDERGIRLITLKDAPEVLAGFTGAAEHSWLLLMACARQLTAATTSVLEGHWNRELFPGLLLRGKTLGLLGCGRIGQGMARYGQAFGMRTIGFDPQLTNWPPGLESCDSLMELVGVADFVSVHVPLTDGTRNLVSRMAIQSLKKDAILVNTSRGEVLDESALLEALERRTLRAAGLDVLAGEPAVADHPLRRYAENHHNLVITPHIGGFCPETVVTASQWAFRMIRLHLGLPS